MNLIRFGHVRVAVLSCLVFMSACSSGRSDHDTDAAYRQANRSSADLGASSTKPDPAKLALSKSHANQAIVAPALEGYQPPNAVNANVIAALTKSLVGGATLDGNAVTAVRAHSSCTTAITTSAGDALFDWSGENPNPAREGADGHEVLRLADTTGKPRVLGLGSDRFARRVDAGIGVLLGNCEK